MYQRGSQGTQRITNQNSSGQAKIPAIKEVVLHPGLRQKQGRQRRDDSGDDQADKPNQSPEADGRILPPWKQSLGDEERNEGDWHQQSNDVFSFHEREYYVRRGEWSTNGNGLARYNSHRTTLNG